jgi:DNA-binding CsgD family transcriptional regulator
MIYVFVDSNIWIRTVSQGKPGCEIEHFNALRALVHDKAVVLLLPEVVRLEFKKNQQTFEADIIRAINDLKDVLSKHVNKVHSEIEDVKQALGPFVEERKRKKLDDAKKHAQEVERLFAHKHVRQIPFTETISHLGLARIISGGLPDNDKDRQNRHNDACIVESLLDALTRCDPAADRLIFCSEDKDFCLQVDGRPQLHPRIKEGLPPSIYCSDLQSLLALQSNLPPIVETPPDQVQAALEREIVDNPSSFVFGECRAENCSEEAIPASLFCSYHTLKVMNALSPMKQKEWQSLVLQMLDTLTLREQEICLLYGASETRRPSIDQIAATLAADPKAVVADIMTIRRKMNLSRFLRRMELILDGP